MPRRASVLCALAAAAAAACGGEEPAPPDGNPAPDAAGPCALPSLELNVATLGGCTTSGTEDGPRGRARFDNPTSVAIGPGGVAYVLDAGSSRLRIIDPAGETITLVSRSDFQRPSGIAVAPDGTIFVHTDANDSGEFSAASGTIWRIQPATGDARVVARNLGRPRGLAALPGGQLAMADPLHHTLSILDPATGAVTPLAGASDQPGYQNGTGADARFTAPSDLLLLPGGDLVVADLDNHRLRRVTLAGVVTDLAGTGVAGNLDGPAASATFDAPRALAITPSGAIYVTDIRRNFIRRIFADEVTTVAGDGGRGWLDSDVPRSAKFSGLEGIDADAARLVVTDGNRGDGQAYHHVRVLDLTFL
jgi:DNA-binding beta-propeller fold protein YncE